MVIQLEGLSQFRGCELICAGEPAGENETEGAVITSTLQAGLPFQLPVVHLVVHLVVQRVFTTTCGAPVGPCSAPGRCQGSPGSIAAMLGQVPSSVTQAT